jgi:hypothetical protein
MGGASSLSLRRFSLLHLHYKYIIKMVSLSQLKDEIAVIGDRIKELKTKGAAQMKEMKDNAKEEMSTAKDDLNEAILDMLAKKQLYAENNNGIGVDGRPFKANMTKAEKRKQQQQGKQQAQHQQARFISTQLIDKTYTISVY